MSSINKTARVAGFLYLLLLPLGIFGLLLPSSLILPGDIAGTIHNIMASESLFRLGIMSALLTQLVNIFVVLALYKLLNPVDKNHAALMVVFSLLGVPIAMLSELNKFGVLLVLNGTGYLTTFTAEQVQALVSLFLDLHKYGINIAGIFWGLWLFPMGYLVFKSGFLPRILGILLMIGCFGYLFDSVTFFLFPNLDVTISQYTFIGEILLPLWLLIKGGDVEKWEKRAFESA